MAVMESLDFNFDGEYSSFYGIVNISMSSGMYEESFAPKRNIKEQTIRGSKRYFQEIEYEPLVLNLSFGIKETWDEEKIRAIARWLIKDYYKPLYFSENTDRIYYGIVVDDPKLIHNGLKQGYITLTFRCDSQYTYSPVYLSEEYDLSTNPSGTSIMLINNGDVEVKPEISITKVGNGGEIKIVNITNGGIETKLSGVSSTNRLSFVGGVLDGDTVTIGDDVYEFDNGGGVTSGNIAVTLGSLIANPTTAPTLSKTTNAGSALAAGTYYVKYTWINQFGETLVSPESNITTSTGEQLTITTPDLPSGCTGINIYMSNTTNTETFQTSSIIKTYTKNTAMLTGKSVPTTNLTVDYSMSNAINKLTSTINTSGTEPVIASSLSNSMSITGANGDSLATSKSFANAEWQYPNITGSSLVNGENIYINGETKTITSSLINVYRYENFNNKYLSLVVGTNGLTIYGTCKIRFRYQNKTLQG